MASAAFPIEEEAGLLDRLGAARNLDALLGQLRGSGIKVPLDQRLRAESFLRRLCRAGVDLGDAATLANWLAPILATSAEAEREIRAALVRLAPAPAGRKAPPPSSSYSWELLKQDKLARWLLYGSLAVLAVAAFIWAFLFFRDAQVEPPPPPPDTDTCPGCALPPPPSPDEQILHFMLIHLMPALFVLIPAACLAWAVLRSRAGGNAALHRTTGLGRRFESLTVPPAADIVFTGGKARRAALGLKSPDLLGGLKLDPPLTITATIREGGFPSLRWRQEARVHEYLLLCERGGGADHMTILADALCRQLESVDVAYTRFDLDIGVGNARHAAGRRSGPRVESLAQVRQRHAGARLILLGGGESLARRFANSGVLLETLVRDFESPLLLDATPPDGWGWRESWLQSYGIAVFSADEAGLAAASAYLGGTADERGRFAGATIDPGEDAFLASLESDQVRLLSNVPPAESEQAYLARRLRGLVGGGDGFRLLVAIAAFPRTHPAITLHLSQIVNGKRLDAALACRLSRLPWLRSGRFPDWLRVALLRGLSADDREHVRARLKLVLDEFRTHAAGLKAVGLEGAGERLEILDRPGVAGRLLAQLGLGDGLIAGEGIFIRFLAGEMSELDQPIGELPAPPSWRRIAAAAAVGLAALVAAALLSQNAEPLLDPAGGLWSSRPEILLTGLAGCYGWVAMRLWLNQRTGRVPGVAMRSFTIIVHGLGYLLLFSGLSPTREADGALLAVVMIFPLALLPIHFAVERRGWRTAPTTRRSFSTFSPLKGIAYFAVVGFFSGLIYELIIGATGAPLVSICLGGFVALVFWGSLLFHPIRPLSPDHLSATVRTVFERLVYAAVLAIGVTTIGFAFTILFVSGFDRIAVVAVTVICAPLLTVAVMSESKLLPGAIAFVVLMILAASSDLESLLPDAWSSWVFIYVPTMLAAVSYLAIPLAAAVRRWLADRWIPLLTSGGNRRSEISEAESMRSAVA